MKNLIFLSLFTLLLLQQSIQTYQDGNVPVVPEFDDGCAQEIVEQERRAKELEDKKAKGEEVQPTPENIYTFHGCNWNKDTPCGTGSEQSPINIKQADIVCNQDINLLDLVSVSYHMENTTLKIEKVGETVQSIWPEDKTSSVTVVFNSTTWVFNVEHFEVHSFSEHQIDGQKFDVEVDIYHTLAPDQAGAESLPRQTLAIALFFTMSDKLIEPGFFGTDNWDLTKIGNEDGVNFNFQRLFQVFDFMTSIYYFYPGSRTVPDCAEDVNWLIFPQALKIGQQDLFAISQLFSGLSYPHGNARHLFPLNNRVVLKGNCEEYLAEQERKKKASF